MVVPPADGIDLTLSELERHRTPGKHSLLGGWLDVRRVDLGNESRSNFRCRTSLARQHDRLLNHAGQS